MREFKRLIHHSNLDAAIREFEHQVHTHKYIENKNRRKIKRVKVKKMSGLTESAYWITSYVRDRHHCGR